MFTDEVIQSVKDRNDIVEIVSGYVSLRKAGRNYIGLCPFHSEKTPSFTVSADKQIYYCFGCGKGGDVFSFIEAQEGITFPEAVKRLAERAGIDLPARSAVRADRKGDDERRQLLSVNAEAASYFARELESTSGSAAREYLKNRGLTEAIIKEFGIGYSRPEWDGLLRYLGHRGFSTDLIEKAGLIVKRNGGSGHYDRFRGRIMFPIRDISGNVIAFGGRVMDSSLPKYMNSPETPLYSKSNTLYGLDRAKEAARRAGYFIIVEGYLDAIACHQYGATNTVATLGTALTEGHLRLLKRFAPKVVMIFDSDPAGVRATLKGFELFVGSGLKVNVASLPEGEDPDSFLKTHGYEAFAARLTNSVRLMDFVLAQVVGSGKALPIEQKVERAREMLALVSRMPSGIERDYYIKKTAEALDVAEPVLRQEAAQLSKSGHPSSKGRTPRPAAGKPGGPQMRPKAEEILIHLMLKDEAMAHRLKEEISPEEFTDPIFRKAASLIFSALESGGGLDAGSLARAGDEETGRIISALAVREMEYQDPIKTCTDCIGRLKRQALAGRMKELVARIREAESRGDQEELRRLLEEQKRLARMV